MIVTNCDNVWYCPKYSNRDITTVVLKLVDREIYFTSGYCDINLDIPPKLTELMEEVNHPVLMGLDTNAHSQVWGMAENNSRGNAMEEFIIMNELIVWNRGTTPTFSTVGRGQTIIDVTLCTEELTENIQEWKVDETDYGSDHRMLTYKLLTKAPKRPTGWAYDKADWNKFRELTELRSKRWLKPDRWTPNELDHQVKLLERDMFESMKLSCPATGLGKGKKPRDAPWWSQELADLRTMMSMAQKRAQRSDDPVLHETYLEIRREYKSK